MSNALIRKCWSADVSAPAKAVLIYLADSVRDSSGGWCWPSLETVAVCTSLNERTVRRAILALEDDGFLVVDRRNGRSRKYQVLPPNSGQSVHLSPPEIPDTESTNDSEPLRTESPKDRTESPPLRTHSPLNRSESPPNPKEPCTNPKEPQESKPAKKRKSKTEIPEDFSISDKVRSWAAEKGFGRLDEHLENFVEKSVAKGYVYADWDAAFQGAIRRDWANLNAKPPPDQSENLTYSQKRQELYARQMYPERYANDQSETENPNVIENA